MMSEYLRLKFMIYQTLSTKLLIKLRISGAKLVWSTLANESSSSGSLNTEIFSPLRILFTVGKLTCTVYLVMRICAQDFTS